MESVYSFNGSAIGFGAVLKSNGVKTVIPSLASVALAPTGGEGSAVVENYNAHGISFTRAESRVFGTDLGDGIYTTYADVYITNLTIFDKLKIALMSATISSTHNLKLNESSFDVRTIYRGLALEDAEMVPEYDLALSSAPTYNDVLRTLKGDMAGYGQRWMAKPGQLENAVREDNPLKPLGGSLVKDLKVPEHVQKHCAHGIEIPGLGRAHFGEFLFKPGRRRVSLLRLKLDGSTPAPNGFALMSGNGDEGDVTVGSVEGNGSPPM